MAKFKKPDDYEAAPEPVVAAPAAREVFFRLKLMPAGLIQYSVERVTIENDSVVERKVVTERDILPITLSKIEDFIVAQIRR